MKNNFDKEIKNVLRKFEEAHKASEKYIATTPLTEGIPHIHNFVDMALAFDTEEYWLNEYEILLLKAFPEKVPWKIEPLLEKRLKLQKNIEKWKQSVHEEKNN